MYLLFLTSNEMLLSNDIGNNLGLDNQHLKSVDEIFNCDRLFEFG